MCSLQEVDVINPLLFTKAIKLRLSDISKQEWPSETWNRCSCVVYRMFKEELRSEANLVKLNVKDRLLMTKFRCRNSKLSVCKCNVDNDYNVNK